MQALKGQREEIVVKLYWGNVLFRILEDLIDGVNYHWRMICSDVFTCQSLLEELNNISLKVYALFNHCTIV